MTPPDAPRTAAAPSEAFASLDPEVAAEDADEFSPPENLGARLGRHVSGLFLVGLVVMMGVEMLARSFFGWSIQWSNEIGGYALVAITFLTLASGQLGHAFHRVHFVEHRLSPLGRARLRLAFDLGAAAVTLVLLLEFIRFAWITFNSGDVAATSLMTPLWMPRLVLPIGLLLLTWAMVDTVRGDLRRMAHARAHAAART
jgi:TRAP-type C4-dicarboxylate transport system permease small subunit